jgi:GalNAc-alpha-(1->4)-GalNAc-alpha-(1->3)-diNAcBac-PP-undecaprenol alpha-1,4-N-acetyl-D-galactosaminyltransferase
MTGRHHIVFVTSALAGGGAERVLLTMARYWANVGHRVTVLVLRSSMPGEYPIPGDVTVDRLVLLDERNPVSDWRHLGRLAKLRARLKSLAPDVVITFIDKLNTAVLIALTGTGIPVIATEHLAPWMNPLGVVWEGLRRLSYRRARCVVSPTRGITEWFRANYRGRFETLPYPANLELYQGNQTRDPIILAVGRLAHQKGFDILIDAFATVAPLYPDWKVQIAGEGPLRLALEAQIAECRLSERVQLLGHVGDVASLYRRADIFALPSRHEAYPMVLCEALAAGCCVVATDCPTGPREILDSPRAGLLVAPDNVSAFAEALERLVQPSAGRQAMSAAAKENSLRLEASHVMTLWDSALVAWWSS